MLGTRHIFVDTSSLDVLCYFIDASCITPVFFHHFFLRHRCFASRFINFQLIKLVSQYALKYWRSNSYLSTHQSSSPLQIKLSSPTYSAGGQTLLSPPSVHSHPSPSSGHLPPILLAVKLSPLHPAVIRTPPHPPVISHQSC